MTVRAEFVVVSGMLFAVTVNATATMSLGAQQPPSKTSSSRTTAPVATDPVTQSRLDEWIVRRFRGAQLLPDSGIGTVSNETPSGAPRIEGPRAADVHDTLVALHFNAAMWRPSLAVGAVVPLADPTGVASKVQGRITARRAFRAPRRPGVTADNPSEWRIGWAYLLAIPARSANAATPGFEGWLLLEPPLRTRAPARPAMQEQARTRPALPE